MRTVLVLASIVVTILLVSGCGGGGGGGGGVTTPTVKFISSINFTGTGWPATSFSATDVNVDISNQEVIIKASGTDSTGDSVEVDLDFSTDLGKLIGFYKEAGYIFIASKNSPDYGDIGTISITNLNLSSNRVSGNFKFTAYASIGGSLVSVSNEGSFDVPAGHWVFQNGQWQQISKGERELNILQKMAK